MRRRLDAEDAEQQFLHRAGGGTLQAESRAGVEGAPSLGEWIEEESRGPVETLCRLERASSADGSGARGKSETRVPAGADIETDPQHGP